MISKKLQDAINNQINKEMYSELFYLSMEAYLESEGFSGFAHFFKIQIEEERFHTRKFFKFLNERGGRIILEAIKQPPVKFDSCLQIFEMALEHEEFVTKSINELMAMAVEEKDFATVSFLNWFIDEQVEEEATMNDIVAKLRLIDGKGQGLLMLDKELSARTFNPVME